MNENYMEWLDDTVMTSVDPLRISYVWMLVTNSIMGLVIGSSMESVYVSCTEVIRNNAINMLGINSEYKSIAASIRKTLNE